MVPIRLLHIVENTVVILVMEQVEIRKHVLSVMGVDILL
jgi:hypothetical protein